MKTKKKETKLNTKIAILPKAAITTALEIQSKTLLNYEKEGILKPEKKENGSRYYSLDDLEKARLTSFLTKNRIMNLAGAKIIISFLEINKINPEEYIQHIKDSLQMKNKILLN